MGLDYVDIFYSHRLDPDTPLEETMGALDTAVRAGQGALRRHLVLLGERTDGGAPILRELGTPLLIHQPSYSLLNRWIEQDLLDVLGGGGRRLHRLLAAGPGAAHRPLPRRHPGRLARQPQGGSSSASLYRGEPRRVRALNEIASGRGQSLAQMAIAWALRDPRVTSALIGARSVEQLEDSLGALENLDFSRRRAGRDRPPRRRGRHQPVGPPILTAPGFTLGR